LTDINILSKEKSMEKKTPLYEVHAAMGGKIVPFAGWLLPVQYETGVIQEHMAVRTKCGLFDVSHMGEILLAGPDSVKNLNRILTNDYTVMEDGQARYSPMCYENGGCVDDLIVYRRGENDYFIVVNAANKDKDFQWIKEYLTGDVTCRDISDEIGQIALQGPLAETVLRKICAEKFIPAKYYHAVFHAEAGGIPCTVSRTGYTGEDGFELYCASEDTVKLWNCLMDAGKENGIIPCGLGARDTLRLEAAMPLYGHEMDSTVSPLETGLSFAVKMKKEDFIGKAAMEKADPPKRERTGLKVTGRGIVREKSELKKDGKTVGYTTSGTHAPFLGYPIAMALTERGALKPGDRVSADVRGREVECEVVPLPFYRRKK
jgi:aminomethyltransferase